MIQGIGAGFVPEVLNTKVYDEVLAIENKDAFAEGRAFAVSEGILVGISSGAALKAAAILAGRPENKGKTGIYPLRCFRINRMIMHDSRKLENKLAFYLQKIVKYR